MKNHRHIIEISAQMEKIRNKLDEECFHMVAFGMEKDEAASHLLKVNGQEILKLKHEHPATLLKEIVRGKLYKENLAKDTAETMYFCTRTKISVLQSELSSLQSEYNKLEYVTENN